MCVRPAHTLFLVRLCFCCSTIAEARSFLAAHGVHYAEGSTNIEPEVNLSDALAKSMLRPADAAPKATAATTAAVKQEHRMEEEEKQHAVVKAEHRSVPLTVQADPAKQLQAFLDAIPDD